MIANLEASSVPISPNHFKRMEMYSECVRSVSKFYSLETNIIFVLRPSLNEWTLNLRSTPSHFGGGAMKREMLLHLLQSKFQSYFGGVAVTMKMPLKKAVTKIST